MTRIEFFKKIMRFALLAITGLLVLVLSRRIITGSDCSVCAGKGICKGETDCSKFNNDSGTKPVKAPPLQKENGFI